jgi:hypothetical protein
MTWQLLYWTNSYEANRAPMKITLLQHENRVKKITDATDFLARKIYEVARSWNFDDGDEDEQEALKEVFNEAAIRVSAEELKNGETLDRGEGKWSLMIDIALAFIDLSFYFYKIYVFVRGSFFFLASIIVIALSEAGFTLCFTGVFGRLPQAIRMTFRSGIQTADFIAWTHWDDGLAGVPYLMVTTIYALPLQDLSSWASVLSAILFTFTGTRAMAKFIMNSVDYDMLDANADEMEEMYANADIGSRKFMRQLDITSANPLADTSRELFLRPVASDEEEED